jgi:hypothetical protein
LEWASSEIDEANNSFSNPPVLKRLVLRGNMIWGEGVTAIIAMLKKQTTAAQVCLPVNDVKEGVLPVAQGLLELDLSNNNKMQEEQMQMLREWCLAAGVALKLESSQATISPVHRKVSSTGLGKSLGLSRPSSAGPPRKTPFRGASVRRNSSTRNKQLLKVAKQRQRALEE